MEKTDCLRAGTLIWVGMLLFGCATVKDTEILNRDLSKLELQLDSVQKDGDSLRREFTVFKKEAENGILALKEELASLRKESRTNISTLRKENDLLKTNLMTEIKNLQSDLFLRLQALQSHVNRIQREEESLRNDFIAFRKETSNDISIMKEEDKLLKADLATEIQRSRADYLVRLDALQSEIRTLSTGVEEYKEFLQRPSQEIDRLRADVDLRMKVVEEKGETLGKTLEAKSQVRDDRTRALEEKIGGVENRSRELDGKIGSVVSKQMELDEKIGSLASAQAELEKSSMQISGELKILLTPPQDLYSDAYQTFQKGDWDKASRQFEAFLKRFPNVELSDNAQFFIGEACYQKKDFEKAILEYEKVIARYPEGDAAPNALLKQALAFSELGDRTNARTLLMRLIEKYPQFDQIDLAKRKLNSIR